MHTPLHSKNKDPSEIRSRGGISDVRQKQPGGHWSVVRHWTAVIRKWTIFFQGRDPKPHLQDGWDAQMKLGWGPFSMKVAEKWVLNQAIVSINGFPVTEGKESYAAGPGLLIVCQLSDFRFMVLGRNSSRRGVAHVTHIHKHSKEETSITSNL